LLCTNPRKVMILLVILKVYTAAEELTVEDLKNSIVRPIGGNGLGVELKYTVGIIDNLIQSVERVLTLGRAFRSVRTRIMTKINQLSMSYQDQSISRTRKAALAMVGTREKKARLQSFIPFYFEECTDYDHIWVSKYNTDTNKFALELIDIDDRNVMKVIDFDESVQLDKSYMIDVKSILLVDKKYSEGKQVEEAYITMIGIDFTNYSEQQKLKEGVNYEENKVSDDYYKYVFKPVLLLEDDNIGAEDRMKNKMRFFARYGPEITNIFFGEKEVKNVKEETDRIILAKKLKKLGKEPLNLSYDELKKQCIKNFLICKKK